MESHDLISCAMFIVELCDLLLKWITIFQQTREGFFVRHVLWGTTFAIFQQLKESGFACDYEWVIMDLERESFRFNRFMQLCQVDHLGELWRIN